ETREGADSLRGDFRWDTDRYADPTKTFDHYDRVALGFGGPTPIRRLTYFAAYEGSYSDAYPASTLRTPSHTVLDFIRLGNRESNRIRTSAKLAWRATPRDKVTFESIFNHSIVTPYEHMWSRSGFVQVRLDTVRASGQPDRYLARYGAWSALPLDSTYVA